MQTNLEAIRSSFQASLHTIAMSPSAIQRRLRAANMNNQALDNDLLKALVPSAFAEDKHSSRSARYAYIPTSAVIEGMRQNGFVPTFAAQSRSRDESKIEHTKHMIRFRQADAKPQLGGLYPEIALINSHDGTSAYQLYSGVFRLVCLNGLMTGESYEALKVHHKGDPVNNVIEGSFSVIEDAKRALDSAQDMRAITLGREQQLAFATAAHGLRFDDDSGIGQAISPSQLLSVRRSGDTGNDLFTVFNRVQEGIIKGGIRATVRSDDGSRRNVSTREVKGIGQVTALNRALWTLTEAMQKLAA